MKWSSPPNPVLSHGRTPVGVVMLMALAALATPLNAWPRDQDEGFKEQLFAKAVFAPDLVIRHQGEIGLTEDQKQSLIAELQGTQSDLVPLKLEMSELGEVLSRLLVATTVEEAQALDAAARVMRLETEIKLVHLRLVIRVKNLLTVEQQKMLRQIQERS
jgi:Spy/CpxP family protein refolding chaperone